MAQSPTDPGGTILNTTPTPTPPNQAKLSGTDLEHVVFWASGAAVLLIITDRWPKAGIALTGLIVAGVLLRFATQVTTFVQGVTQSSTTAPGGSNQSGTGPRSRVVALPTNSFLRDAIRRGA